MSACSLMKLPLELRHQIYSHLVPKETQLWPVRDADIGSVSHRPPTSSLLVIGKDLSHEIYEYFWDNAVWAVNVQYSFNFYHLDPHLEEFSKWARACPLRHIELLYKIEGRLMLDYMNFGLQQYCKELQDRTRTICEVLAASQHIEDITVHCNDTTKQCKYWEKNAIFIPLTTLPGRIQIRCGKLEGPDAMYLRSSLMHIYRGNLAESDPAGAE